MNVNKEEKFLNKKDILIYVISILVCIIALIIATTVQFMGKDVSNKIFGMNKTEKISEETQIKLEKEFENMFKNDFQGNISNKNKIVEEKEFVYTDFEKKENISEEYNIDINIPRINIKSEIIDKYNQKISTDFKEEFKKVFSNKNNQILYFVEYKSFVEDNVLTLIIRTSIKEGSKAQQVSIDTYNYDFVNDKEVSIFDMISKLNYDKEEIQTIIKDKISEEEKNSKALKELGYNVFVRDSNNEMYLIENTKCFYILNNKLYIIYPYGNNTLTSTIDIVII